MIQIGFPVQRSCNKTLWSLKLTNNRLHFLRNIIVFLQFLYLHFRSGSSGRLGGGQVCCEGAVASLVPEENMDIKLF